MYSCKQLKAVQQQIEKASSLEDKLKAIDTIMIMLDENVRCMATKVNALDFSSDYSTGEKVRLFFRD